MTGTDVLVARVDAVLRQFLDERAIALHRAGADLEPVTAEAREFVLDGGKRMRPTFAYWGWRSVRSDSDDDSALLPAIASLELLHGCALVHDDVMDASSTRRGRPSAHEAFATMHREAGWAGSSDAFGAAAAILLGDLLLCWADALFASARVNEGARAVYDEMREMVMAGQYLDVLVQAQARFSPDEALRVAKFKTSKYTVEGPLHLGAAAAGATPAVSDVLSSYGLALGEAFQLRDDVLGVFGDPDRTGKPAGDDIREGKQTLLVALAMERCDPQQAVLLRGALGDRDLSDEGVEQICDLIVATGSLDAVEERIAARTAEAMAALDGPGESDGAAVRPDARQALRDLATAATQRHR